MKTLHLLKSEANNVLHICDGDALEAFNKRRNKEITVSSNLTIKPWQQICRFEFQIEQAADEFKNYLKTDSGIDFAHRYFFLNPLSELKKF